MRRNLWLAGMAIVLIVGCGKKEKAGDSAQSERGDAAVEVAKRRPYVVNNAGIRFDPPAQWDPNRVDIVSRAGDEAGDRLDGASFAVTFDYKAEQPAHRNQPLLNLYVFPKAKWSGHGGEVIDSTNDWVFVASMPDSNPYREGLLDADQFEAMRLSFDDVREAFSIEKGGPADASLAEKGK